MKNEGEMKLKRIADEKIELFYVIDEKHEELKVAQQKMQTTQEKIVLFKEAMTKDIDNLKALLPKAKLFGRQKKA